LTCLTRRACPTGAPIQNGGRDHPDLQPSSRKPMDSSPARAGMWRRSSCTLHTEPQRLRLRSTPTSRAVPDRRGTGRFRSRRDSRM